MFSQGMLSTVEREKNKPVISILEREGATMGLVQTGC